LFDSYVIKLSTFKVGNLPDGDYKIVVHPGSNSLYTESAEKRVTIKDGKYTGSNLDVDLGYIIKIIAKPLEIILANLHNGAINVPINKKIEIKFNSDIQFSTNASKISIVDSKNKKLTLKLDLKGNVLTIIPKINMSKNKKYTLKIPQDSIKSLDGITNKSYVLNFNTVK
jgi:hypothetical protein